MRSRRSRDPGILMGGVEQQDPEVILGGQMSVFRVWKGSQIGAK